MLSDRLNTLINELQTNKSIIASYANINRTGISHIASGKRIPPKDSPSVTKIVDGIYKYALDNDKLSSLVTIVDIDNNASEKETKEAILNYLYRDMSKKYTVNKKSGSSIISDKINLVMTLLNMPNKELSNKLHTDPSQISRYRNGTRSINTSSAFATHLINCLWNEIIDHKETDSISSISGIPESTLNKDTFKSWLFDSDIPIKDISEKNNYAKKIIEAFSQSSKKKAHADRDFVLSSKQENIALNFIGKDGLRNAVEHFFSEALDATPLHFSVFRRAYGLDDRRQGVLHQMAKLNDIANHKWV